MGDDSMESDKTIFVLSDRRWLLLRISPLVFIAICLAVTLFFVGIVFPEAPWDQLPAKLPGFLARVDWIKAAPDLAMFGVVFAQLLYIARAQRLEQLTLSPEGIRYTSPLPPMLKRLKPDWFLPWHQVEKAELGFMGARLVNEAQVWLALSSPFGKRNIFPALWVDPCSY